MGAARAAPAGGVPCRPPLCSWRSHPHRRRWAKHRSGHCPWRSAGGPLPGTRLKPRALPLTVPSWALAPMFTWPRASPPASEPTAGVYVLDADWGVCVRRRLGCICQTPAGVYVLVAGYGVCVRRRLWCVRQTPAGVYLSDAGVSVSDAGWGVRLSLLPPQMRAWGYPPACVLRAERWACTQ